MPIITSCLGIPCLVQDSYRLSLDLLEGASRSQTPVIHPKCLPDKKETVQSGDGRLEEAVYSCPLCQHSITSQRAASPAFCNRSCFGRSNCWMLGTLPLSLALKASLPCTLAGGSLNSLEEAQKSPCSVADFHGVSAPTTAHFQLRAAEPILSVFLPVPATMS